MTIGQYSGYTVLDTDDNGGIYEISTDLTKPEDFFHSGATLPVPYRLEVLSLLEGAIQNRQEQIESALAEDLGKSQQEAYSTEIAIVLSELRYAKRHLNSWARKQKSTGSFEPLARSSAGSHLFLMDQY